MLLPHPELRGDRRECGHDQPDVVVQVATDVLGTPRDIVPVDPGREAGLLQLLPDRLRLEPSESVGTHSGTCVDEAGKLVAGVQVALQRALARQRQVVGVAQNRAAKPVGISGGLKRGLAVLGMLVKRGVSLVVEVVQKTDVAPDICIFSEFSGIGTHRGLGGKDVAPEPLAPHPFVEQCDRPIPIARDSVIHVQDLTVAPRPLREALARADAASTALLGLGIPQCPACELLPTSLREIRRARPGLTVEIALLGSPADWADREQLLWPRAIRVSRASVPVLVLLRRGQLVATRAGGGPASAIDAWLTEALGPPDVPLASGLSELEIARLAQLDGLRTRHLATRGRSALS